MEVVIQSRLFSALATGLLTGGLFFATAVSGLGFLFLFLAMVPLLMAGLGRSARHALDACLVAALLLGIFGGWELFTVFTIFFGLPAWYLTLQATHCHIDESGLVTWQPVGYLIADMAIYSCVIMGAVTLHYALYGTGIELVMEEKIREALTDLPPQYAQMAARFSTGWSFLVFSMLSWMWAIGFYAHAWLANRILARQNRIKRASLAVEIFSPPDWLLYLLAVAALASLIGSPSMQFFGKASFITLLLPYFFLGLALIHHHSKAWAGRGLLLFFIYFMMLSQLWMALLIAAFGLFYHLKRLNKRLPPGQISPK